MSSVILCWCSECDRYKEANFVPLPALAKGKEDAGISTFPRWLSNPHRLFVSLSSIEFLRISAVMSLLVEVQARWPKVYACSERWLQLRSCRDQILRQLISAPVEFP